MQLGRTACVPPSLLVAVILSWLPGCEEQAESPTDRLSMTGLVVLSPHGPRIRDAFADDFSIWYEEKTGRLVSIRWIHKGTVACQRYIYSGHRRDPRSGIGVDVFFGGGVAVHRDVAARGFAQPIELPESIVSAIPVELNGQPLRAADGTWYGSALSGFGILCNRAACAARGIPVPKTWSDLASPAYSGWMAAADPASSGSTVQCLVLILLKHGWENGWGVVMGILANCNGLLPSSAQIGPSVASGLAVVGLEPEFVAQMTVAADPESLEYVHPPPSDTAITPDPITVLKGAPNFEVARRFVEFVLSLEGQRLWALPPEQGGPTSGPLYRYPIRPDAYERYGSELVVKGNPFTDEPSFRIDPQAEAAYMNLLPHLLSAACGENHLPLQQAWRSASGRAGDVRTLAALKRPPFDQEAALRYAAECAESPDRARELEAEWSGQLRQKYAAAIRSTTATAGR